MLHFCSCRLIIDHSRHHMALHCGVGRLCVCFLSLPLTSLQWNHPEKQVHSEQVYHVREAAESNITSNQQLNLLSTQRSQLCIAEHIFFLLCEKIKPENFPFLTIRTLFVRASIWIHVLSLHAAIVWPLTSFDIQHDDTDKSKIS